MSTQVKVLSVSQEADNLEGEYTPGWHINRGMGRDSEFCLILMPYHYLGVQWGRLSSSCNSIFLKKNLCNASTSIYPAD